MNFNEYKEKRDSQLNGHTYWEKYKKILSEKDKSQVIKNLLSENIQENIIHEIVIALDNTTDYHKNGRDGPRGFDGTPSVLSIAQAFHKKGLGPIDSSVIDDLIINHVNNSRIGGNIELRMNKLLPLIKYLNPEYIPSEEARERIATKGEGFVNKVVAASRESTGLLTRTLERMSNINIFNGEYNMRKMAYYTLGATALGTAVGAAVTLAPATALASIAIPALTGSVFSVLTTSAMVGSLSGIALGTGHIAVETAVKAMSTGLNFIRKTLDHTFTNVDNILKAADKQSATLKIIEQEQQNIQQNNTNQNVQLTENQQNPINKEESKEEKLKLSVEQLLLKTENLPQDEKNKLLNPILKQMKDLNTSNSTTNIDSLIENINKTVKIVENIIQKIQESTVLSKTVSALTSSLEKTIQQTNLQASQQQQKSSAPRM
jgi:hypothetical protein